MSQDEETVEIELGPVSIQWIAEPVVCPVCGETVGSGPWVTALMNRPAHAVTGAC